MYRFWKWRRRGGEEGREGKEKHTAIDDNEFLKSCREVWVAYRYSILILLCHVSLSSIFIEASTSLRVTSLATFVTHTPTLTRHRERDREQKDRERDRETVADECARDLSVRVCTHEDLNFQIARSPLLHSFALISISHCLPFVFFSMRPLSSAS